MTPIFLCGEPHLYSLVTEADWPSLAPQPGCPPRLTPRDLASNSPAHQTESSPGAFPTCSPNTLPSRVQPVHPSLSKAAPLAVHT